MSRCCVGIADGTDDKVELYIIDSLKTTACFYETDAALKINATLQSHNDSMKKMEVMSSIFTGIGIKTIDRIHSIEVSDDNYNQRSSSCDVHFSNNGSYDTLSSLCKLCRSLSVNMRKSLNYLTPPTINISTFSRID